MKAITIMQPWASLIVSGHKTIETRSWPVPEALIGQRVAVHAALALHAPRHIPLLDMSQIVKLPRRALLGTVKIVECVPTSSVAALGRFNRHVAYAGPVYDECFELILGDYSAGRYGWLLSQPESLPEPYPMPGRQRFFDVEDDLLTGTIPSWRLAD